jgi:hypothetical protein
MLTENAQQVVKQLLERFQSGDIAPLIHIATIKLENVGHMPSEKWSLCNRFLALLQTGEVDCRGFRQWEQVKRHVVKGAHAAYILGPVTIKKVENDVETFALVGFKSIPVFPLSMTDGEPLLDEKLLAPAALPPLAEVAAAWGIPLQYVPFFGDTYGSYSDGHKEIRLCTHDEKVFFHELAHAAHSRIEKTIGGQDPRQETIAEFTSCVLMQVYGLRDSSGYAWQYISHYNPDNPLKAITEALETIDCVLEEILSTASQIQIEKGK